MDRLAPHIAYRTEVLQHEAHVRRLAASSAGPASEPHRARTRRRVLATTLVGLSIAIGSSGALLAFAAEPTGTGAGPDAGPGPVAPALVAPAPGAPAPVAPAPASVEPAPREVPAMPAGGGYLMHD